MIVKHVDKIEEGEEVLQFYAEQVHSKRLAQALHHYGVNSSFYMTQIDAIAKSIRRMVRNYYLPRNEAPKQSINDIYDRGIAAYKMLQDTLKEEHKAFFLMRQEHDKISKVIDEGDFTEEKMTQLSNAIIRVMKALKTSTAKLFSSQTEVINGIYALAYQIIKKEMQLNGVSAVLEWVKKDQISLEFISAEMEKDVNSLIKNDIRNHLLKVLVANRRKRGLNGSFIDDQLLLGIVLRGESVNIHDVEVQLLKVFESIEKGYVKEDELQEAIKQKRSRIDVLKERLKNTRIFTEIGSVVVSVSMCLSLLGASIGLGLHESVSKKYTTKKDTFSTEQMATQPSQYILHEKLDNSTVLATMYSPSNSLSARERTFITYDVSSSKLPSLKDYTSLDLSSYRVVDRGVVSDPEGRVYDQAILEISRLSQKEGENVVRTDVDYLRFISIVLGISLMCGIGMREIEQRTKIQFSVPLISTIYKHIKEKKTNQAELQELETSLIEVLTEYRELYQKDELFAQEFNKLYYQFEGLFENRMVMDAALTLDRRKSSAKK